MTSHPDHRTILFADICGSTAMYERLGNETAHQLVERTLALMSREVEAKGGQVVKTIGDEIMACFWHPVYALDAAKGILHHLSSMPPEPGLPLVAVHIGMTHGPVVQKEGDLFGDAVNIAARLSSLAKPWQILTTDQTVEALGPESREITRQVPQASLRGKAEELDIFELVWDNQDLTRSTHPIPSPSELGSLLLRLGQAEVKVNPAHPVATLGRGSANDLVAEDKGVSRWHARVEMRRGRCFLVDMSTNGTFVHVPDKPPVMVNYEEILLPPAGYLVLGRESDPQQRVTVFFSCDQAPEAAAPVDGSW